MATNGRRQSEEQPERRQRDDFHPAMFSKAQAITTARATHHPRFAFLKPREHAGEVGDEQRGINRHIEDGGDQREPGFLKSPEVSHGAANPGVVTALVGQRARKLADHEGRGQAPEQRGEQQDQNRASVACAVHDVFGAIGSA